MEEKTKVKATAGRHDVQPGDPVVYVLPSVDVNGKEVLSPARHVAASVQTVEANHTITLLAQVTPDDIKGAQSVETVAGVRYDPDHKRPGTYHKPA